MDSVTKSRFFVKMIGFESYCLRNDSLLNIIKEKREEAMNAKYGSADGYQCFA